MNRRSRYKKEKSPIIIHILFFSSSSRSQGKTKESQREQEGREPRLDLRSAAAGVRTGRRRCTGRRTASATGALCEVLECLVGLLASLDEIYGAVVVNVGVNNERGKF